MNKSESIIELSKALNQFQGKVGSIKKDSVNPFFKMKYASLTTIWVTIRPLLSSCGLSVVQGATSEMVDGHLVWETKILHTSGEWISAYLPIKPKNDDPQGMGSAITYARRYALCAILGIVADEDDDGNVATKEVSKPKEEPKPKDKYTQKMLAAKAVETGYTPELVKAIMARLFHAGSSKDLNQEQMEELMGVMENGEYKEEK